MAKIGTWGTQVELLGAATFYKVPIYRGFIKGGIRNNGTAE